VEQNHLPKTEPPEVESKRVEQEGAIASGELDDRAPRAMTSGILHTDPDLVGAELAEESERVEHDLRDSRPVSATDLSRVERALHLLPQPQRELVLLLAQGLGDLRSQPVVQQLPPPRGLSALDGPRLSSWRC
jgi:hypothetical protein